jgi:hypothetical protein
MELKAQGDDGSHACWLDPIIEANMKACMHEANIMMCGGCVVLFPP